MSKSQTKRAIQTAADVCGAGYVFSPEELRAAAAHIRGPGFISDKGERTLADAIASFFEQCASRSEAIYRKTYQSSGPR